MLGPALPNHPWGRCGVTSYDLKSGFEGGQPTNKPTDGQPKTINNDPPFPYAKYFPAACID